MRCLATALVMFCLCAAPVAAQDRRPVAGKAEANVPSSGAVTGAVDPASARKAGPTARTAPKVIDPPISDRERREADARRSVRRTPAGPAAAQPEKDPGPMPVSELAARLQKVLDSEAARAKSTAGQVVRAARREPPGRVGKTAPLATARKAKSSAPDRRGVVLDWGRVPLRSGVNLVWDLEPSPGPTTGPTSSGVRLSWSDELPHGPAHAGPGR